MPVCPYCGDTVPDLAAHLRAAFRRGGLGHPDATFVIVACWIGVVVLGLWLAFRGDYP